MSALSCAGASADAIADGVGHGAFASSIAGSEYERPCKRKRRPAGTPDPGAEVVALSPKTLMESDRYVCEICNQGFQRDQNLQMHRRRHKVPWKLLKKPSSIVTNRRVYICPERSCLHHDPAHALGDLVGIKKHYRRKHCTEKQWKCVKCSKRYAVQSDYKAHLKTCGTRGHCCDCGRVFSRVESFIEHQDTCSAVTRKAGTQSNSSLLRHIADKILSSESSGTTQAVSFAHMSDTADVISTKPTDEPRHPSQSPALKREVAMPFWLIARECRSNLELSPSTGTAHFVDLNSVPRGRRLDRTGSIGQLLPISLHGEESVHSPCLRLSIGPAASSAETASSCLSPHPSCRVDHRNPRSRSVDRETRVSSSHFVGVSTRSLESSSHSAAIGKDLALSIPDRELPKSTDRTGFSDFLGQATWLESCNAGLCQSLKKHPMYNRSTDAELQPVL